MFQADHHGHCVIILSIDYSSAFNTIVPTMPIIKLRTLGLSTSLCNCILDFLTGLPQVVRIGNNRSATLILNTGDPQGCVPQIFRKFYSCTIESLVASPLGMATAQHSTVRRYRG
jgi:hypothetical protein